MGAQGIRWRAGATACTVQRPLGLYMNGPHMGWGLIIVVLVKCSRASPYPLLLPPSPPILSTSSRPQHSGFGLGWKQGGLRKR